MSSLKFMHNKLRAFRWPDTKPRNLTCDISLETARDYANAANSSFDRDQNVTVHNSTSREARLDIRRRFCQLSPVDFLNVFDWNNWNTVWSISANLHNAVSNRCIWLDQVAKRNNFPVFRNCADCRIFVAGPQLHAAPIAFKWVATQAASTSTSCSSLGSGMA